MEKNKIRISTDVYTQLEEIFWYIGIEKRSPEKAFEQTNRIWKAIRSLSTLPKSHALWKGGKTSSNEYRQLIIDQFLVIFTVDEENKQVFVFCIYHQKQNR